MSAITTNIPNHPPVESLPAETQSAVAEFAGVATPKNAGLMDELVKVWLHLARLRSLPSAEPTLRDSIERLRQTRELKLKFMRARFQVRTCDSLRKLSLEARNSIAKTLFEMPQL